MALALIMVLSSVTLTAGRTPTPQLPASPLSFSAVRIANPPQRPSSAPQRPYLEFRVPDVPNASRPPQPVPQPLSVPLAGTIEGVASWYCNATHPEAPMSRCLDGHPDSAGVQLIAAIRGRPDVPLRHRRDRATVCRVDDASVCVSVVVLDCNCGPDANLIDLYSDAFKQLGPLSGGLIHVTLRWER